MSSRHEVADSLRKALYKMKVTKISEVEESVEVMGYTIKRNVGGICTECKVSGGSLAVGLGQRVYSNGQFGPPDGTLGIVVGIEIPGHNGHTTNIIKVWFEGQYQPLRMKFKDLQTEKLRN